MSVFDVLHMLRARRDANAETQMGLLRAMQKTQERVAKLEEQIVELQLPVFVDCNPAKPGKVYPVKEGETLGEAMRRAGADETRTALSFYAEEQARLKRQQYELIAIYDDMPKDSAFEALLTLLETREVKMVGFRLNLETLRQVRKELRRAGIDVNKFG